MRTPMVVIDTNVLVAGLRSRNGTSFRLLKLIGGGHFEIAISVPLVLEYEAVLQRQLPFMEPLTTTDISDFIDYLCAVGKEFNIYYLWRPTLSDPKDEMVLEVAVAANCRHIVTYNTGDFGDAERFGITTVTPWHFLRIIGEIDL
jgi:putative PIN family toxin of toxin-antitoxin system